MASRVTVLTINNRRQNVKVEPNTTILQVLEEVCQKHQFSSAEYDLKHHNKILDLTIMFRFAGLPNNAILEMVPAKKVRVDADVLLVVQQEDGSRLEGTFKSSTTLLEVINSLCHDKANEESNPVMIYMRKEVLWDSMSTTTLKSLGLTGGRAIIRLLQRKPEDLKIQANVSAPLPRKEKSEDDVPFRRKIQPADETKDEVIRKEETDELKSCKKPKPCEVECKPGPSAAVPSAKEDTNKNETEISDIPKPDPIINLLGDRQAVIYHLETSECCIFELPDSFYEVTVSDVRKMYADLRNNLADLDEAPLMTSELRQLEEEKKKLNQLARYKNAIIRVQFPDRHVLQGFFKLHETIRDVMAFVRGYLETQLEDFHLYTTPPKQILEPNLTLLDAKCVPQALLHFGCHNQKGGNLLKSNVLGQLSNATGASVVASRFRVRTEIPNVDSSVEVMETSVDYQEEDVAQEVTTNGARIPNKNFRPSSVQTVPSDMKLPKWFKPLGK